jgi:hypothetical protein
MSSKILNNGRGVYISDAHRTKNLIRRLFNRSIILGFVLQFPPLL